MVEHINGWLNIYKQKGLSSFFISKALKKKLKIKKIGHLGTLDPLAEGVLPIAIGEATKSIAFITNNNKRYSFKIKWGEEKDTCDEEGKTVYKSKERPTYKNIITVTREFFNGTISQIPPKYSAIKVNGVRAYKLARNNLKITLNPRKVKILKLKPDKPANNNFCKFDLKCGSGTYVRSLARDISRRLGTYGYAYEIIRTENNAFNIKNSISLDSILNLSVEDIKKKVLPIEFVLSDTRIIILEKKYSEMLKNGMIVNSKLLNNKLTSKNKLILVKDNTRLVCIANLEKEHIVPRRNFNL